MKGFFFPYACVGKRKRLIVCRLVVDELIKMTLHVVFNSKREVIGSKRTKD